MGLTASLNCESSCQLAPLSVESRPNRSKPFSPVVFRSSYQLTNTSPAGVTAREGIHCPRVVESVLSFSGVLQLVPLSAERM